MKHGIHNNTFNYECEPTYKDYSHFSDLNGCFSNQHRTIFQGHILFMTSNIVYTSL